MIIQLQKFGTLLTDRPFGKECWLAYQPTLRNASVDEEIVVDFSGVTVFGPSWGDEFLTPLYRQFGDRLVLRAATNASVKVTVAFLERLHGFTLRNE